MSTVREEWGLACPKCYRDDSLQTTVETLVKILPDGTEDIGDHEWSIYGATICTSCGNSGVLEEFRVDESEG